MFVFIFVFSQLLQYLNAVNFTTPVGDRVYFEDNREPSASYDIMNWHIDESGTVNFVHVGQFDVAKGAGQELNINLERVVWGGGWDDQVNPFTLSSKIIKIMALKFLDT